MYDAAGEITNDTVHSYTYDAKGLMIQVDGGSTATYTYDAIGKRVGKTTPSAGLRSYLYETDGRLEAEFSSGGFGPVYVYFGGKLVGEYSNSTLYYFHQDQLGSARVLSTTAPGTNPPPEWPLARLDFLPFGEESWGDLNNTDRVFAGDVRDAETDPGNGTGNDYALARHYGSRLGRFLTPDPAGTSATCLLNPQTQNRYAYVTDNPVNQTDPTGLCGDGDNSDCGGIGITLPIFPGGGGDQPPAPPTPHPVFDLSLPLLATPPIQTCKKVFGSVKGLAGCVYFCYGSGGISGELSWVRCGHDRPNATQPCPDEVITIDGHIDTDEFCGPAPKKH